MFEFLRFVGIFLVFFLLFCDVWVDNIDDKFLVGEMCLIWR